MLAFKPCENFLLLLLLPPKITTTNSKPHLHHHHHVKLHFPPKAHFKSTQSSPLSPPPTPPDSLSLTADFLMDSGGLSSMQALHLIKQVPSLIKDGSRKPRSVISYLESIGFSKTHISKLISIFPKVIVADVEKTLQPKIQIFHDFGFSDSDIADLIASKPSILHRSLKTQIKPALDLIKRLVKTNEDLIKTIKRNGILLVSTNRRKSIEPNIDVLRHHGVPESEIVHLMVSHLQTLMSTPEGFERNVKKIVSIGFKPETRKFSNAIAAISRMKKATWDLKVDMLKGMGWSEMQILDAFRRHPKFITLSCENLKESIEFYAKSMNWDASIISHSPIILNLSLKTRVIPRYAVLKCLMSKEIIEEDKFFIYMLRIKEDKFLSKYVFKYQDQLPNLYEVYKKKEGMYVCRDAMKEDNGDIDMTV